MAPVTPLRTQIEPLNLIPNSGLQLPVISPDGRLCAYLRTAVDDEVHPASLLDGRGLRSVSCYVAETQAGGQKRGIVVKGACWPVFADDSRLIACVQYDTPGSCRLIVRDHQSGHVRATAAGVDYLLTPAVSPDARWLAVSTHQGDVAHAAIRLVDSQTMSLSYGPTIAPGAFAMMPIWVDGRSLVYIASDGRIAELHRWTIDEPKSRIVTELRIDPATPLDVIAAFAGIAAPLSPDRRRFAYYDAAADRIRLLNLVDGAQRNLDAGTRAGCWVGAEHFAAATDHGLRLIDAAGLSDRSVMTGPTLPRWAATDASRLIVCMPASNEWTFQMLSIELISIR